MFFQPKSQVTNLEVKDRRSQTIPWFKFMYGQAIGLQFSSHSLLNYSTDAHPIVVL